MIDWAVVTATFVGPVAAVIVTRWLDDRRFKRERQYSVFRALMASRAVAISPEHVSNSNLVEIEFHDDRRIIEAWSIYIRHLNEFPKNPLDRDLDARWGSKRQDLLAILLTRIAHSMGLAKGELEIRNGGYAPQAWQTRELDEEKALKFVVALAEDRAAIPLKVVRPQDPPPT